MAWLQNYAVMQNSWMYWSGLYSGTPLLSSRFRFSYCQYSYHHTTNISFQHLLVLRIILSTSNSFFVRGLLPRSLMTGCSLKVFAIARDCWKVAYFSSVLFKWQTHLFGFQTFNVIWRTRCVLQTSHQCRIWNGALFSFSAIFLKECNLKWAILIRWKLVVRHYETLAFLSVGEHSREHFNKT